MLPYDDSKPRDIERYAKGLIGKTFQEVLQDSRFLDDAITDSKIDYSNPNQKGKLGNLLEEKYFCYKANSDQSADFPKCGVELKVTCYDALKNGNLSAGERLVLTMISYEEPVELDFYQSHVWEKCRLILLVYYERNRRLQYNTLYKIGFVKLVSPLEKDMPVIIQDYNKIIQMISMGKAHLLSESSTMYLGACTKGATSAKSMRPQYYNPTVPARKRAFCFKRQYMDYILHSYIMPGKASEENLYGESIIDYPEELREKSFEDIVLERIAPYKGRSDRELCAFFGREYNNNKAQWTDLVYRMLGIKGNHAEEFVKANIVVKTIRLQEDGSMRESLSFPPFKFIDLAEEKWHDSEVYHYFNETKFLFVIFRRDGDCYRVYRYTFWNMPNDDLENDVKNGWKNVRRCIRHGVRFSVKETRNGFIIKNSLPKKKDNRIIHVRPHSAKKAYLIHQPYDNDIVVGDVEKDANMLPQGDYMTTQSFWINNQYILTELFKDIRQ